MTTLREMQSRGHEQVVFVQNSKAGLAGIIAIHGTVLGPALGGTRMYPYASEEEALRDVLQLSRGMTYKAAAAGLNLGGGKAVIIGDPRSDKSEALFRAFGRYVNGLNGLFYTGEDVGTEVRDLETVAQETAFVGGLSRAHGGGGDPSPVTAYGVFEGIKACAAERWGSSSVRGRRVALQGLGKVGWHLARRLQRAGATVIACDLDPHRSQAAGNSCTSRRSTQGTSTESRRISSRPVRWGARSPRARCRNSAWTSSPVRRTIRSSVRQLQRKSSAAGFCTPRIT